ncbi:MAG: hypothetical protein D6784_16020 [Chloroflexi bacterium]|nr:MAG: hypothetical protein D6784_16020 [Chloroflexota bacterium]
MAETAQKMHEEAVALFRAGQYEAARQKLEEALTQTADEHKQAEIYNDLGVICKELEDFNAARTALDEAMTRFTRLDDKKGQGQTLGNRAALLEAEEAYEEAVEAYKQSAALLSEAGENEMAMYAWQAVSRLRMKQKRYIEAIGAYEEGVEKMPNRSFKKKVLQNILKIPGSMLGGGRRADDEEDEEEDKD